jgi:hypothetical protein
MTSRKLREYLRTHVLGLVAIFIALTGTAIAGQDGLTASSSKVTDAKFKKLKKRVAAVESKLNGPVTGDLNGVFPNLTIANNAVTTAKIANNAVSTAKIADNAVSTAKIVDDAVNNTKIAASAVGSSELATVSFPAGTAAAGVATATATGALPANCPAGQQALGGGGFWSDLTTAADGLTLGALTNGFGGANTFLVAASNQSGATQTFTPQVVCLAP